MANFISRLLNNVNGKSANNENIDRNSSNSKVKELDYTAGVNPQNQGGVAKLPLMSAARYFRYGNFPDISTTDMPDPIYRPINKYAIWMQPPVDYSDMLNAYMYDAEVKFGMDFVTSITFGSGYHFSSPHNRIVEYFEDFADDINLDHIIQTAGFEFLAFGDSVWRYANHEDKVNKFDQLVQMPLTSLKRIWWNGWTQDSTIGFYEFRGYAVRRYLPSELIHFRNTILNGVPYGYGLLAPLVQKVDYKLNWNGQDTTYTKAATIDMKRSIEDSAHKIIKRYMPRNVYKAANASPQQVSALNSAINQLLDEQDFVVPDKEFDVIQLGNQKAFDLEAFEQMYVNAVRKATANPVSKLFEDGSLTEASSTVAKESAIMHFNGPARKFKRQIERFILKAWYDQNPTTDANGVVIPWKLAELELEWGEPEKMEIDGSMFARLVMAKPEAFSIKDIRQVLADNGLPIDPKVIPSPEEQQMAAQYRNQNAMFGGMTGNA